MFSKYSSYYWVLWNNRDKKNHQPKHVNHGTPTVAMLTTILPELAPSIAANVQYWSTFCVACMNKQVLSTKGNWLSRLEVWTFLCRWPIEVTKLASCHTRKWHQSMSLAFHYYVPTHLTTPLYHFTCTTELPQQDSLLMRRRPYNREITMAKEAHELTTIHFAVRSTNPPEDSRAPRRSDTQPPGRGSSRRMSAPCHGPDDQTKLQPLTRRTLITETTPNNNELFLAKWERFWDRCLKQQNQSAAAITLQLWDRGSKDLQTVLRINGKDNTSREAELPTKMKAVTLPMHNVIVNVKKCVWDCKKPKASNYTQAA